MKFLIASILSFIVFIIVIRYIEMTSVFHPTKSLKFNPLDAGLTYEDVSLETKDHFHLNGWLVKGNLSSTILFFHGNAGNIADRLDKIKMFHNFGLNVFIIDYRGFGKSDGSPTEEGTYRDAQAAYEYLLTRQDVQPDKIIFYGESLGGAVAINLATKTDPVAVIIDSTFTSATEMANRLYPFIPSFLVGIKFDSLVKVPTIDVPKLFIHSREDEIVPFDLGKKLYNAAVWPKEFLEVRGGHNDAYLMDTEQFRVGIEKFLKQYGLLK